MGNYEECLEKIIEISDFKKWEIGHHHKPFIKECTFLENIDNKFLLVSLGNYKECITVRDIVC